MDAVRTGLFSSLLLMGMVLASFAIAQDRDEHRWENLESLKVGQKLEVTTTQLRAIQGTYLNSSEAAIRLKTPEGEFSVMREEVFRVKSQEGKRKQNTLVGVVVGALSGVVLGAVADYKDDVDGSDPGKQQRQTWRQCSRSWRWRRHRVAVRWASFHLPCEGSATTLVEALCGGRRWRTLVPITGVRFCQYVGNTYYLAAADLTFRNSWGDIGLRGDFLKPFWF